MKKQEIIDEVLDEIKTASQNPRGLVLHQRRLVLILSLGTMTLIELYFQKLNIWKEGSQINHRWFHRKKEALLKQLQNQIITPINSISNINKIIDLAVKIEEKRDDLAYGAKTTEGALQEKINLFFSLQELTK